MGMGAKLAYPEKTVFVITGDGSFLFNGVELETAARYNVPIVVVIVNDSAWGMVYHQNVLAWKGKKKASVGTKLSEEVRYDKFAESLGCCGEMVTDPAEIKPAIQRAMESGKPAVVDVRIDPEAINLLDQYFASLRIQISGKSTGALHNYSPPLSSNPRLSRWAHFQFLRTTLSTLSL